MKRSCSSLDKEKLAGCGFWLLMLLRQTRFKKVDSSCPFGALVYVSGSGYSCGWCEEQCFLGETKERGIPVFAVLGISVPQSSFAVLLLKGSGSSMASFRDKAPETWKSRLQCLRRLPGYTAEPVFCDGVGFVQLSVLVPLQSCCKPGQGKQLHRSKR